MNDPGSQHRDRIPVGGIKFSTELVLISVQTQQADDTGFNNLLKALARNQVNLPFLCHSISDAGQLYSVCVEEDEWFRVKTILKTHSPADSTTETTTPVGTLTLYPHRNSFHLLGRIVTLFGETGIPFYGLCTSISAVTFCTDYRCLDDMAEHMQQYVKLPENHAPFKPEFVLKQPRP